MTAEGGGSAGGWGGKEGGFAGGGGGIKGSGESGVFSTFFFLQEYSGF